MSTKSAAGQQKPPPPTLFGIPLAPSVAFGRNPGSFILRQKSRLGPIFRANILGEPTTIVVGGDALRCVLSSHREHFASGTGWPKGLRILMDGGLMLMDGIEHQQRRRALVPAFTTAAMTEYAPTIRAIARLHMARWERIGRFRWYDELKRLTFDVAAQVLLGLRPEHDIARFVTLFSRYVAGMAGLHPIIPIASPLMPFGRALRARVKLLDTLRGLVVYSVAKPSALPNALGLMLAETPRSHDIELAKSALFLLFAGHESTASLITSACLELGRNRDLLALAREEASQVGPDADIDALEAQPLLERILLETERLHSPFPGSFRRVQSACEFGGYRFETGTRVFYSISATHTDPETFSDPGRFNPHRFSDGSASPLRRQLALVGFGGGPRSCLGMKLARLQWKIVLSMLLREYEWVLSPGQRLCPVYLPSLYPMDRLEVAFQRLRSGTAR